MSRLIDLTGQKFGRLTVIARAEHKGKHLRWNCECECGNECVVASSHLRTGHTKSCGCYAKEVRSITGKSRSIHGMDGTPTYNSWRGIIKRCTDPNNASYQSYGGRGIKVCDRWMKFKNFLEDMGVKPEGKSIDRKDTNGDYCPENCQWSTAKDQARNRNNNRLIEFNGEVKCITQWSDELGIPYAVLNYRLSRGWDVKRALTQSVRSSKA